MWIRILGSVLISNGSRCGSGRPKNIQIQIRVFSEVTLGISRKSKFYTKMVLISQNFEYFHRPRMSLQGPRVSLQRYRVRLHGSKINHHESRGSLHGPRVILHKPRLSMKAL
jgi:hypothetical protein